MAANKRTASREMQKMAKSGVAPKRRQTEQQAPSATGWRPGTMPGRGNGLKGTGSGGWRVWQ